jgi:TrmH family RNA methyltransferase
MAFFMISSLTNERVKLARLLLTQGKARRKERKIALEGMRLIRDALVRGGMQPDFILYDPERIDPADFYLTAGPILAASDEVIRHVSTTEQPQGAVGVFPMPTPKLPASPRRVLILDGISDPGNEGTILRTAAAAGVDAVLLSPGCVDLYNDKVLRGGMGAHFRLIAVQRSWAEIAEYVADLPVYLADMYGDLTYDAVDWRLPWTLIVGSEAHGASTEAADLAQQRITIPMAADTESLNAAAATAVILFEAARQARSVR